ncbi:MAG: hypothetical protein JXQ29_09805 [Planctomycetes bacterium]|nr:hypothetical protein [Planctomycetota bacterium]
MNVDVRRLNLAGWLVAIAALVCGILVAMALGSWMFQLIHGTTGWGGALLLWCCVAVGATCTIGACWFAFRLGERALARSGITLLRASTPWMPGLGPLGSSPSAEYPEPLLFLEAVLERYRWETNRAAFVTFSAPSPRGEEIVLQVLGVTLNTCAEPVDLSAVLARAGWQDLATRVYPAGENLHELRGAGSAELARAVDAVFRHHFGLPAGYRVAASL